jgi:hypothetical protein
VDAIADIIGAVDTPLGLLALVIIGFFALAWKFGKELISLLKEIRVEQATTKEKVEHVSTSIVTNHGSKTIGDAVDRLTGWFMDSETERAENTQLLQLVATRLDKHIADCEALRGQPRAQH